MESVNGGTGRMLTEEVVVELTRLADASFGLQTAQGFFCVRPKLTVLARGNRSKQRHGGLRNRLELAKLLNGDSPPDRVSRQHDEIGDCHRVGRVVIDNKHGRVEADLSVFMT